ncbi:MAG: serine/threonine protein kinase, partial [Planctomycetes bacterium]|nr:serine/threonine protein kinase [Planctomycetota bacterium]
MSVVCLAEDLRDGSRWAVKFLPPALRDDGWRAECLRREYRLARGFSHPSLVRLRDLVRQDDQDFLILEAVDGTGLREILEERRLSLSEAIETGKAVAGALHYIHESDRRNWLVHGDVKPENVLIRRGEGPIVAPRAVLIDFGTMTVAARTIGGAGWIRRVAWNLFGGKRLVGCSSLYVSPEQATGKDLDPRADVYSLGAVLYELFAGRPPFLTDAEEHAYVGRGAAVPERPRFLHRHLDRELLHKHVTLAPAPPSRWNPDLPPDLSRLVMRCLAKPPEERFPDMLSLLMELTQMKVDADGTFRNARRTTGRTSALHERPAVVLRVVSGPQQG